MQDRICQVDEPLATRGRTIHLGQKRRFASLPAISGLPRTTDIVRPPRLVRFVPDSDVELFEHPLQSREYLIVSRCQIGWRQLATKLFGLTSVQRVCLRPQARMAATIGPRSRPLAVNTYSARGGLIE